MSLASFSPSSLADELALATISSESAVCFPIEVLEEFVLWDRSVSSLRRWCLVNKALLNFAGTLLYEDVTLTREEDILPFIRRLCLPPPPGHTPCFNPVPAIKRLKISTSPFRHTLAIMYEKEFLPGTELARRRNPLSLVCGWPHDLRWPKSARSNDTAHLLLLLRPATYTEEHVEEHDPDEEPLVFSPPLFQAFTAEAELRLAPGSGLGIMKWAHVVFRECAKTEREAEQQAALGLELLQGWDRDLVKKGHPTPFDGYKIAYESCKDLCSRAPTTRWIKLPSNGIESIREELRNYDMALKDESEAMYDQLLDLKLRLCVWSRVDQQWEGADALDGVDEFCRAMPC